MAKTKKKKAEKDTTPKEVVDFEKGITQLYKKNWASAAKTFEGIVEHHPGSALAERARRFIEVCEERTGDSPPATDTYLSAVFAKNAGDLETSKELCSRGGLKGRDERFAYLAAALESLSNNNTEALRLLEKAIEMNPANRVHAFHDPDFADLRADVEAAELFNPN